MPSNWAMIDNNFPTFTGEEKTKDQIRTLQNYMYLLVEQMKYNLENLDTSNWNTKALTDFQADTTEDVEKELDTVSQDLTNTASDLLAVAQDLASISARVAALEALETKMNQAETDIAYLQKEGEEAEQRLEALEESMGDVQADMDEVQLRLDGLEADMEDAQADIEELKGIFRKTDTGASLGAEGADLHLLGNVYINGKRME